MSALDRFVEAQAALWPAPLGELRAGAKTGHWMWFVFPQLAGLGQSATARFYGITGIDEARAYLAHPLLGRRLEECLDALAALPVADAVRVFGGIDAMKLRSSLTLFEAAGGGPTFAAERALVRRPRPAHARPAARRSDFCGGVDRCEPPAVRAERSRSTLPGPCPSTALRANGE